MDTHLEIIAWIWQPFFPVSWIFILSAVAIICSLFAYSRIFKKAPVKSVLLLMLRLCVIGLVTVILLGPSRLLESESTKRKGKIFILADVSESMLTDDQDGITRLDQINQKWLSNSVVNKLREDFSVEIFQFAENLRVVNSRSNINLEPKVGEDTHLIKSVASLINKIPNTNRNNSMLILSDGIDSEDGSPSVIGRYALAKKMDVHTVSFGSNSKVQDAAIIAIPLQEYVYPNETGSILAKIYQSGCDNERSVLNVRQGDETRRIPVNFNGKEVIEVKIPFQHEEAGQYEYQLSLNQVTRETELGNNNQTVFAMVQPRRMQVLLIEGQPFWDTKFIAQSLRKDERIELTHISQINRRKRSTIVTRSDEQVASVRVPETYEQWSQYDVVIFGKDIQNVIDSESAKALVQHIETTGGNLVYSRGRPYDPEEPGGSAIGDELGLIEPIIWGDNVMPSAKLQITMSGKMTEWFTPTKLGLDVESAMERLPGFTSTADVSRTKPNARVLAETLPQDESEDPRPALVTSSTGSGSVVTILGEGIWRWSLLSSSNQDLGGFYDAFWSNMIRWLVVGGDFQPGQQVTMKLSRSSARSGEEITIDVVLKQALQSGRDPTMEIKLPDGQTKQVPLTPVAGRTPRLRGKYRIESDGVHEVLLDCPGMTPDFIARKFNAYSINVERLNTAAQPMKMKMIADQTGGQFYNANECDKFLQQLVVDAEATKIPPKTVYIWDQSWLMLIMLTTIGLEWIFRKISGLI